jgi:hypothetical protein
VVRAFLSRASHLKWGIDLLFVVLWLSTGHLRREVVVDDSFGSNLTDQSGTTIRNNRR